MTRGMIGSVTGARAVIAAVVVALGVSACSGSDPEPKIAPPESSAPRGPSTSPVSGPTAPTMPPEALGTDAAAAEAFVRFYWDTVNYAQETGDVSGLQRMGLKCPSCDNGVEFIRDAYARGGEIRGGQGRPKAFVVAFVDRDGPDWAVVECRVLTNKQVVDLPGVKNDQEFPGGADDIRVYLQPMETGWAVRSLAIR